MNEIGKDIDPYLAQLVLSLQAGAMQQMGKIASPFTGEVERDLQMAKASIDMLSMIETKSKGNLTDEESKMLTGVLYNLRMNFIDESKNQTEPTESESTPKTEETNKSDKPESSEESDSEEK